jgi:hypothetical protein
MPASMAAIRSGRMVALAVVSLNCEAEFDSWTETACSCSRSAWSCELMLSILGCGLDMLMFSFCCMGRNFLRVAMI